jgi:hypothetical protein
MKTIFTTQKVYSLTGSLDQIRVKMFNKIIFKYMFNHNLKTA